MTHSKDIWRARWRYEKWVGIHTLVVRIPVVPLVLRSGPVPGPFRRPEQVRTHHARGRSGRATLPDRSGLAGLSALADGRRLPDRIERGDPQRKKVAVVATAHYLVRVMWYKEKFTMMPRLYLIGSLVIGLVLIAGDKPPTTGHRRRPT